MKSKVPLIVSALAGAMLVVPLGATAQDPVEAGTPAIVSGQISLAASCQQPKPEQVGDVRQEYGYRCAPQRWDFADPRLNGSAASEWNADVYRIDGRVYSVTSGGYEVDNETGGWSCVSPASVVGGAGLFTDGLSAVSALERLTCVGRGDNEGLTAILELDWTDWDPVTVNGVILTGDVPPLPEVEPVG